MRFMTRRAAQLAALLSVLLLVAGSTAWAQKTVGEVRGTVTDASGAVLPGATVSLTNVNTGYTRERHDRHEGGLRVPGRGPRPVPRGRDAPELQEVQP